MKNFFLVIAKTLVLVIIGLGLFSGVTVWASGGDYPKEIRDKKVIEEPRKFGETEFTGKGLDKSIQLNVKGIQELLDNITELAEENLQQQAEIETLKLRMDKIDELGTDPVIVDEEGNLLSISLFVGSAVLVTAAVGFWLGKRK